MSTIPLGLEEIYNLAKKHFYTMVVMSLMLRLLLILLHLQKEMAAFLMVYLEFLDMLLL